MEQRPRKALSNMYMISSNLSKVIDKQIRPEDQCSRLSPLFNVRQTKYGGRGCFATQEIATGTHIFCCGAPLGSTIIKSFRKEVCTYCFYYDGSNLKSRISKTVSKNMVVLLVFCSNQCVAKFKDADCNNMLEKALLDIEAGFMQVSRKPEPILREPALSKGSFLDLIDRLWVEAEEWDKSLSAVKHSSRHKLIPRISDAEYVEVKFAAWVAFQIYKDRQAGDGPLQTFTNHEEFPNIATELSLFSTLESNIDNKVRQYPYLLESYINVFKFLRLIAPGELQSYITTQSVRDAIGRNLLNAFGIWSDSVAESCANGSEEKEFLGFGVFPLASFFNHSCEPNLQKCRSGNTLYFKTTKNVEAGGEMCIDYGDNANEAVVERQAALREWFFDCQCSKCIAEGGTL